MEDPGKLVIAIRPNEPTAKRASSVDHLHSAMDSAPDEDDVFELASSIYLCKVFCFDLRVSVPSVTVFFSS